MRFRLTILALLCGIAALAAPVHLLEGTVLVDRYDYEEALDEPLKSTELGTLVGGRLAYLGYDANGMRWRITGEYTNDTTEFDGTNQAGDPRRETTGNLFLGVEGNLRIGTARVDGLPCPVVFYTGVGARAWDRKLRGENGFSERYEWMYVPLGARGEYPLDSHWSGAVDVALLAMIDGSVRFDLSDVNPDFNNPRVNPGNRLGARIETPFYYSTSDRLALIVAPWYEYSALGESDMAELLDDGTPTGIFFQEPSSRTHRYGVYAGVRVRL